MKIESAFKWCPAALALMAASTFAYSHATEPDLFTGTHGEFQQNSGHVVATYVANWSNPASISQINGNNLTHILYAFLDICGPGQRAGHEATCTGKPDFTLAENNSTIDKAFSAQFSELKTRFPHLKVLPSIGGWGGDGPFAPMSMNSTNRQVFVQAMVDYLKANPAFDGVDIDWEWPQNRTEGEAYADLMIDLRAAMDKLSAETSREYLVTSAIATAESYTAKVNYQRAEPAMDLIFLMTYDFFGAWSSDNVGHHTAISAHSGNLAKGYGFGAEDAVQNLLGLGMPAEKLVLGVAKYAKGWDGVALNPQGSPFGGVATAGFPKAVNPWDVEGIATYTRISDEILGPDGLGVNGFEIRFDPDCQCHYAWRGSDAAFVGFDHPADIIAKGQLATSKKLGGLFSWEYGQDNGDLLNAMNIGVGNLDMKTLPDVTDWQPDAVYLAGDRVRFNHFVYQAKWWSQNDEPGHPHGPWEKLDFTHAASWSAEATYQTGDRVTHNGVVYQAMWWTLNNEPGAPNSPWTAL
ncbi:glycosyl hydrolase family 18 protein [Photobacterium sp. 2_MG-2023]|uniref:glycosyl hydrolase family 18 protein n=1 Tax=Photobacterium sp. 2_MG-2023 TaxID=3062663 RepID=UPI0026E45A6D|nr:glycosyl hydrolase family 18 protein [Photobacterium sp. 2_MG-2023]MDO6583863.1 glycosyl hydrolase family 18 protein [Photobacterium sp. 2_MG-2023]